MREKCHKSINCFLFTAFVSCDFNYPNFYSHVYVLNGSGTEAWTRNSIIPLNHYFYIFFSRRDDNVTVSYQESSSTIIASYTTIWTKKGKDIDKIIYKHGAYCRLLISGTGVLAFTETVKQDEFCDGNIYPINYPNVTITLTESSASPEGLPYLVKGEEFCILYANPFNNITVSELDMHWGSDKTLYTMGNKYGTLSKNTKLEALTNTQKLNAPCFYFKLKGVQKTKKVTLDIKSYLNIPNYDLYPTSSTEPPTNIFTESSYFTGSSQFSPSSKFSASNKFSSSSKFSASSKFTSSHTFTTNMNTNIIQATPKPTKSLPSRTIEPTQSSFQTVVSKTPTQTRKVNILTDNPEESPTEEISVKNNFRAIIVKSPLSRSEVATVATTATLMTGMIVAAVVMFLIYVRSKTKRMKDNEILFDDSDITDSSTSNEYSFSYSYYYSSSNSSSASYYLSDSQYSVLPVQIAEQPSERFSVFYLSSMTV